MTPPRILQPAGFEEVARAWDSGAPVVLLPPGNAAEHALFLGRLPPQLPGWARLAVFTSGSTGEPKAVLHSESTIRASAAAVAREVGPGRVVLTALAPWGMAGNIFGTFLPLVEPTIRARGVSVAEAGSVEADFLFANPWQLQQSWLLGGRARAGRIVSLTGPLPATLRENIPDVEEIWGMTEAAGPVLWNGRSLGAECVLAPDGELLLSGPQIAPDQPRPFPSGDLFEKDAAGLWRWVARKKQMINVAGRKVPPRMVESLVEKIPGVRGCLAVGVSDALYGERVGLLLEGAETPGVEGHFREILSRDLLPVRWVWVDALPRLPGGKPDLAAARRLLS